MKTGKYVQSKYYYMNTETGELLTLQEMLKQAREEYNLQPARDFEKYKELFIVTEISRTAFTDNFIF